MIDQYLNDEDERLEIARAGQERTLREHTYAQSHGGTRGDSQPVPAVTRTVLATVIDASDLRNTKSMVTKEPPIEGVSYLAR